MGLYLTPQSSPPARPAPATQQLSEPTPHSEPSVERGASQANDRRVWWISLFVLCAVLGALLGLSFKTQDTITKTRLPARNFEGLAEQYKILKDQNDLQQKETLDLRRKMSTLENSMSSGSRQAGALVEDLNHAKFLAGLTSVTGPGIIVTLNDSKKRAPDAPAFIQNSFIIHDIDLNQAVNELKAAGAEAISINDQRLVALTPVRCAGPTVYVNNTPQTPPYIIQAIGDSKTLGDALNLPGGVIDNLRTQDPAMIKTQDAKSLKIPAYSGPSQPKYAKPDVQPGGEVEDKTKG